jgi:hypothetical protein
MLESADAAGVVSGVLGVETGPFNGITSMWIKRYTAMSHCLLLATNVRLRIFSHDFYI